MTTVILMLVMLIIGTSLGANLLLMLAWRRIRRQAISALRRADDILDEMKILNLDNDALVRRVEKLKNEIQGSG
jgi:hypothetical protein